ARLSALAREAQQAVDRGELTEGVTRWRSALDLLPAESAQHAQLQQRIAELSARIEREGGSPAGAPHHRHRGAPGGAGALAFLLWKFKAIALLLLGKAKLLLFGLTKMSTLLSMFASLGVYWTVWGWKFAAGLVASIYVHEIGHVAALRRYGIPASAPMFVPGLGAYIRSSQYPATPREDARVGLAGPLWGLYAVGACYAVHLATGWNSMAAIARVGAWINLFNLLPIATLDGGRLLRVPREPIARVVVAAKLRAVHVREERRSVGAALVGAGLVRDHRTLPPAAHRVQVGLDGAVAPRLRLDEILEPLVDRIDLAEQVAYFCALRFARRAAPGLSLNELGALEELLAPSCQLLDECHGRPPSSQTRRSGMTGVALAWASATWQSPGA
ncbi:MAG: site-2 protease family protein, partial [Myxococcota bacterium]